MMVKDAGQKFIQDIIKKRGGFVFTNPIKAGNGVYWAGRIHKAENGVSDVEAPDFDALSNLLPTLSEEDTSGWFLIEKHYIPDSRYPSHEECLVQDKEGNIYRVDDPELKRELQKLENGQEIPPKIVEELKNSILVYAAII